MPVINLDGPPIKDLDKKRELVKTITKAAAEAFGLPEETIIVLFREYSGEHVASGGTLIADRHN